jgi:hypothetical protein
MAKCMAKKGKGGLVVEVTRVSDDEALQMVKKGWGYISKNDFKRLSATLSAPKVA